MTSWADRPGQNRGETLSRPGRARQLLDAACAGFRNQGIEVVETYARKDTKDEAANHHGPLAMYLAAGFAPVKEDGPIVVVRKSIGR